MNWQIAVLSRIILGHIIGQVVFKKISGLPSRILNMSWMFSFCVILSIVFVILIKDDYYSIFNKYWLEIAGIGVFNGFAAYCLWRAVDISLSKTALFTQADDLTAMLLGYLFLGEAKFLNLNLVIGIIICFSAGTLIVLQRYTSIENNKHERKNIALIFWVAGYSFIWGVAGFSMRYFALEGVSFSTFLTSWYSGSVIGILFILSVSKIIQRFVFLQRLIHLLNNVVHSAVNRSSQTGLLFLVLIPKYSMKFVSLRRLIHLLNTVFNSIIIPMRKFLVSIVKVIVEKAAVLHNILKGTAWLIRMSQYSRKFYLALLFHYNAVKQNYLIKIIVHFGNIRIWGIAIARIFAIFILSMFVWVTQLLGYWAKHLAPLTVTEPIFLVSEMIFPALIGLWFFKERQDLTTTEKIAFPLGLAGGTLVGFAY